MKPTKFLQITIFFFALWAILNLFNGQQNKTTEVAKNSDIVLAPLKTKFTQGSVVQIKITNNKEENLMPWDDCPLEPLDVFMWDNGEWIQKKGSRTDHPCSRLKTIAPGETQTLDYSNWNHEIFFEVGRYKVVYLDGKKEFPAEFEIKAPSLLVQIWNGLFYKPIYNTLIFFTSILPGYNLGWAIVLLTILIKILLLGPNHKALKAQKALQKIQPELEKIKEKHKGDQQKIAQETMAVWKKHKVNPMGSCLPMLIQFPIMIAVFYVVKSGLSPNSIYLLYAPLKGFDFKLIDPVFLGILNLTEINLFVLPLIVGGMQFFQMKLSFALRKNKEDESKKKEQMNQMQAMNTMMTYTLPVMIAFFTATMPSAVGIYWGVSTLFGILQQLYINKKHH